MNVRNMTSKSGNKIANQFIIREEGHGANGNFVSKTTFQSYDSTIAQVIVWNDRIDTVLDEVYWNYSVTTSKYRNIFLNEDRKTTEQKIASGQYRLANLN